jgi:hypothetical protein
MGEPFLILQITPYLEELIIAFADAIATLLVVMIYPQTFMIRCLSDNMTSDNPY